MLISQLFDVSGRVAVVTGAASGIGKAIAAAMSDNGAQVVPLDIDPKPLAEACDELRSSGGSVDSICLDVSNRNATREAIAAIANKYRALDVCIANAGVSSGPSHAMSAEGEIGNLSDPSWDQAIAVNLAGTVATIQAAATVMIPYRSGRIVVTSSNSGIRASSVSGYAYVAAKAALNNVVRHASLELGRHNITVNAIAPGYIVTNIANGILKKDAEVASKLAERIPLRRLGHPSDLSGIALFLASEASSYLTGTVIPVDGGVTAG